MTLSVEQQKLARRRIQAAGHTHRIDVDLLDYRKVTGAYDAIASVEMIEAVGHAYWPTYFETVDALLAPGGRFCTQGITMPHDRMLASQVRLRLLRRRPVHFGEERARLSDATDAPVGRGHPEPSHQRSTRSTRWVFQRLGPGSSIRNQTRPG